MNLTDLRKNGALGVSLAGAATLIVMFMLVLVFYLIFSGGFPALEWSFLSEYPREANMAGGILPAIVGTSVMTIFMTILVVPIGVITALYLSEYAPKGVTRKLILTACNNLAGVPSIVFGLFGVGFFIHFVGGSIDNLFFADKLPQPTYGTGGIMWAAMTMALLTLPVVVVSSVEAMRRIPDDHRQASVALGATRWQTVYRVVIPGAIPGILTGVVLAVSRGVGEVAPIMLLGAVKQVQELPLALNSKFMHLGFHIYDLACQSPNPQKAMPMVYATATVLLSIILILNSLIIFLRHKQRKKSGIVSLTGNF
ncbi:MAG: phosphate ABC transporter permease PstA [bacterium]